MVFQAVSSPGLWPVFAKALVEHSDATLKQHKTPTLYHYSSRRVRELRDESLLLPKQPFLGIFLMRWEEGSDSMLKALNKNTSLGRMDCSELVMNLIEAYPAALFWGLNQGWGEHFGLMKSRQLRMNWTNIQEACIKEKAEPILDKWLRQWARKNPSILQNIIEPTYDECVQMAISQKYLAPKQLEVLKTNPDFQSIFQVYEGLGEWTKYLPMEKQINLFQPFLLKQPLVEFELPLNLEIET